ncbi:hypothetical protein BDK51DRAFT_50081 [Blyttiomyces helicus]|uniref:Uncharacterized protein n=1 Tax=Blyttiomyces helicus TaxID=388810 RepID=A0A4P9W3V5_9FUNG|nr:hypothetical protein BDK51DRAFT_50081 [Blyttiomyces helicus]|eukprot:RKO85985.1 hypothetical protein BDK51DRAFT_50081 [Blyttiomyces helicus]
MQCAHRFLNTVSDPKSFMWRKWGASGLYYIVDDSKSLKRKRTGAAAGDAAVVEAMKVDGASEDAVAVALGRPPCQARATRQRSGRTGTSSWLRELSDHYPVHPAANPGPAGCDSIDINRFCKATDPRLPTLWRIPTTTVGKVRLEENLYKLTVNGPRRDCPSAAPAPSAKVTLNIDDIPPALKSWSADETLLLRACGLAEDGCE